MKTQNVAALAADAAAGKLPRLYRLPFLSMPNSPFIKGWAHILAAAPKVGKTELLIALARWWTGEKILWFTEESVEVWGERLAERKHLQRLTHIDLGFAFGEPPEEIQDMIWATDANVIIVDTIRMFGVEDENNNAAVSRALTPYIKLCRDRGQTLILVHHTRKTEGTYGAAISGGHAYAGIVDVLIEVTRMPNGPENRRKVSSLGRIASAPDILYDWDEEAQDVRLLGAVRDLGKYPSLPIVLGVLDHNWQTGEEVRDKLVSPKLSKDTVRRCLLKLWEDKTIERDPADDKPRGTYYWRLKKHGMGPADEAQSETTP